MSGSLNPLGDKYRLIYYGTTIVIKGVYDIKSYDDNITVLKCGEDCITVNGDKIEIKSMKNAQMHYSAIKPSSVHSSVSAETGVSVSSTSTER